MEDIVERASRSEYSVMEGQCTVSQIGFFTIPYSDETFTLAPWLVVNFNFFSGAFISHFVLIPDTVPSFATVVAVMSARLFRQQRQRG